MRTFSFLSHFSLNKFANFFADYLISKHVSYVIDLYHHIKEMKGEGSQRPQNQYILGEPWTSVGIVLRCIPMTAVSQCQVLQIWKFREYILDQSQGNSVFNTQSLQPSLQYIYQVKKLIYWNKLSFLIPISMQPEIWYFIIRQLKYKILSLWLLRFFELLKNPQFF